MVVFNIKAMVIFMSMVTIIVTMVMIEAGT